jgi:hypothetical protein
MTPLDILDRWNSVDRYCTIPVKDVGTKTSNLSIIKNTKTIAIPIIKAIT